MNPYTDPISHVINPIETEWINDDEQQLITHHYLNRGKRVEWMWTTDTGSG